MGGAVESVVRASLIAMGGRGEHLLRGHTAPENTEAAAGLAVVDEREAIDLLADVVDEPVRDGDAGATVGADDDDVHG